MNERALTVFEQYELDITETFKIRGNYGCNKIGRASCRERV